MLQNEMSDVTVEVASEPKETENVPSWISKIRQFFWKTSAEKFAEQQKRVRNLTHSIEINPGNATNYVFRAEVYLEQEAWQLAQADFEKALKVAEKQIETDRWGLVAQTMQDRAFRGLQLAQKRLK
jgi:cytochrome c-type biogenesis protein CcmH/NrfG